MSSLNTRLTKLVALGLTLAVAVCFAPTSQFAVNNAAHNVTLMSFAYYWPPPQGSGCSIEWGNVSHLRLFAAQDAPSRWILSNVFIFFPTASIPDRAIITGARLKLFTNYMTSFPANSYVTFGWVPASILPIDCSDYSPSPSASAGSRLAFGFSLGSYTTITLSNVSNVSKTGLTGLVLSLSGIPQPALNEFFHIRFDSHTLGQNPPLLEVDYIAKGLHTVVIASAAP